MPPRIPSQFHPAIILRTAALCGPKDLWTRLHRHELHYHYLSEPALAGENPPGAKSMGICCLSPSRFPLLLCHPERSTTRPSLSGTSSITFTPSCTIPNIANATPPTSAASCLASPSWLRPPLLCHPERSRIVRMRPILRSRGTPCLLARTTGVERSSLREPHRVACAVKTPPGGKEKERQPRDLSTPLKMTRVRLTRLKACPFKTTSAS